MNDRDELRLGALLAAIRRAATARPSEVHYVTTLRTIEDDKLSPLFSVVFVPAGVDLEAWCRGRRESREARGLPVPAPEAPAKGN